MALHLLGFNDYMMMEVGDRFMPYEVLLLNKDRSSEVSAEVNKK